MPTTCYRCNKLFDLIDGHDSVKWFPDFLICEECHCLEEKEIEKDEEIMEIEFSLSDAKLDVVEYSKQLVALGCKVENHPSLTLPQLEKAINTSQATSEVKSTCINLLKGIFEEIKNV